MYLESLYDVAKFATFAADDTTPYTYYPTGISRTQLDQQENGIFYLHKRNSSKGNEFLQQTQIFSYHYLPYLW